MRTLALALLMLAACRAAGGPDALAGRLLDAAGQAHCRVVKDPNEPLIVEWSGTDTAQLEARLLRGLVAVRYEDCEMEVLPACQLAGSYVYGTTTTARQRIHIASLDDLMIDLPLGLAQLGARVERGEALDLDLVVVGRYEAPRGRYAAADLPAGPECAEATHVVTGVSLGAFRLTAHEETTRRGGVAGAGAGSAARVELVRESPPGLLDACAEIAAGDDLRRASCTAPIRLEVAPLRGEADGAAKRPPTLASTSADAPSGLVAHQAHEAAVRAERDPASSPERIMQAWCFVASIEADNPHRVPARAQCERWRGYLSGLHAAEARMIHDYEDLRLLLELRSVAVPAQERSAARFLDAYAALSAERYPRVRAVQRARQRLARGQRASLPRFSATNAEAGEAPRPEEIDRATYRKAVSVALLPRWIPGGLAASARVLGRIAYVHEVGFEIAYADQRRGQQRDLLALATYERVFRPDRVLRPAIGAAIGALIPVGPCDAPRGCTSAAGVLALTGGARVSITPWFSLVAQGLVLGLTAPPHVSVGLGGGLEFTIPAGRDWPQ